MQHFDGQSSNQSKEKEKKKEENIQFQCLFQKVRACVRFSEKGQIRAKKMLKKGKLFENLGKNVQNSKIF